jgi:alpha-L-fucosidase 2
MRILNGMMMDFTRRQSLGGILGLSLLPTLAARASAAGDTAATRKALAFDRPADHWIDAFPVGNGRLGAMVFGGITAERLQLNHIELWSGRTADHHSPTARTALPKVRQLLFEGNRPEANRLAQTEMMTPMPAEDFGSYQMLGDLSFAFDHADQVSDYVRELDLQNAEVRVRYRIGTAHYTRTILASFPDKLLLVRLETTAREGLNFTVRISRGRDATVLLDGDHVQLSGKPQPFGVDFAAHLSCAADGGRVEPLADGFRVVAARSAILRLSAATDLIQPEPRAQSLRAQSAARSKSWPAFVAAHRADFTALFDAVDLSFASSPLPARADGIRDHGVSPALLERYFHFGRYLLISSTRPGSLPPNLQGLWADGFAPPWSADYHININLQMNFWPAEVCGLGALHMSLFDYAERLKPHGERTARIAYGAAGAVAHYTSNPWGHTIADGNLQYGLWPEGLAWLSLHFWQHYLYSGDALFLRERALPFLAACAEFTLDYLVEHPKTGKLVFGPACSPENAYVMSDGKGGYVDMGGGMAQSMAYAVLRHTADAAHILGAEAELMARCEAAIARLQRLQIGPDGRILEWSEPLPEQEPGHRHVSHLFGLFPGIEIDPGRTPELADAARKTLAERVRHGGGQTGWSAAWLTMYRARLGDGEEAYAMLAKLLAESTRPNLLDTHPFGDGAIFQIDGNLGATAAIVEMLLQSHDGSLRLLPALPRALATGSIRGVRARGAVSVDMSWEDGRVRSLVLRPEKDVTLEVVPPPGQTLGELVSSAGRIALRGPISLRGGRTYRL